MTLRAGEPWIVTAAIRHPVEATASPDGGVWLRCDGDTLYVPAGSWTAFTDAVRRGDLDLAEIV